MYSQESTFGGLQSLPIRCRQKTWLGVQNVAVKSIAPYPGITAARERLAAQSPELASVLPDDAALLAAPVQKLQIKLTHIICDANFADTLELGMRAFQATMHSLTDGATLRHLQSPYSPIVAPARDHFRWMIRLERGLAPGPNGKPRRVRAIMDSRHATKGEAVTEYMTTSRSSSSCPTCDGRAHDPSSRSETGSTTTTAALPGLVLS